MKLLVLTVSVLSFAFAADALARGGDADQGHALQGRQPLAGRTSHNTGTPTY